MHVAPLVSPVELARGLVQRAAGRTGGLRLADALPAPQVPGGPPQLGQVQHCQDEPTELLLATTHWRVGYCYCYIYRKISR